MAYGTSYGTILSDLEHGKGVDLLPDRGTESTRNGFELIGALEPRHRLVSEITHLSRGFPIRMSTLYSCVPASTEREIRAGPGASGDKNESVLTDLACFDSTSIMMLPACTSSPVGGNKIRVGS
jgi:hypothetical protein